jgi:nucleotide-binding universal stress UspA family protein
MFENILVPTDGSECANAAVGYAEELASHDGSTVHVLSVVDARRLENAPQYENVAQEHVEITERTCDELAAGVSTEQVVRSDVPHSAILKYASDEEIDLIVMGTHGRTGVERYLLGSVTEKVVRLADSPVLTVNTGADGSVTYPYTDILVPTDGSAGAEAAVEPAVDIASTYDARVHALSVIDTMAMGVDVRSMAAIDALEDAAQSAVDTVEERARDASVSSVETTTDHGSPYRGIRSYVDDHDIDLVVMGTHGRTGVERYLLGSVTEKTVRTSSVPVMTVRQPE